MGKIRAAVIGSEEEQQQKEKRDRQREGKKAQEAHSKTQHHGGDSGVIVNEEKQSQQEETATPQAPKAEKKTVKKQGKKKIRSLRYQESRKLVARGQSYKIGDALDILVKMKPAKFDETVELHFSTIEKGISGNVVLPNGTGKKTKVAIISPATDPANSDKLLKEIESGKIDFDVLVATPDAMPKLAKVARILGPRGLMPNPKNGTITPKPQEVAKKYEGGQISFKTEPKAPIIHISVGKLSFGKEKLSQNIKTMIDAIDSTKVQSIFLKSTMSPSLKLEK